MKYFFELFFYCLIALFSLTFAQSIQAGAFFETGQTTLTNTIDNGSWVTVTTQKTYTNPVVIAGPLSHNNDNSLSIRVRNASGNSFQIGMQSPCENAGSSAATCPSSWSSETVSWLVMERGTWVFPDGTKIEAYIHNTSTVRSRFGGNTNNGDTINYSHSYSAAPAVLHTVNSFADSDWISTSVFGPTGSRGNPPTTAGFRLALEGAEVTTSHNAEDIAWVAIERGSGTNNSIPYSASRTANNAVDRHTDECQTLAYGATFSGTPNLVAQHNTMSGGDGAWLRLCDNGLEATQFNVHMEEDQVNDLDRTGVPEYAAWFAFQAGSIGALEFLTATKTFSDADGNSQVGPGELVTFNIAINNLQDDFAQANNAADEFVDTLDANLVPVSGSLTASSGSISLSGQTIVWNGSVPASGTVNLSYQAQVADNTAVCSLTNIANQAELRMDPIDNAMQTGDLDNLNNIVELSDDPATDDGADSDMDGLSNDDDPTLVPVACSSDITVSKTDGAANTSYTPGADTTYTITVTNNGPHNLIGATVTDNLPDGLTINGTVSCTITTGTGSCGTQTIVGNDITQLVSLNNGAEATITVPVTFSTDPADYP